VFRSKVQFPRESVLTSRWVSRQTQYSWTDLHREDYIGLITLTVITRTLMSTWVSLIRITKSEVKNMYKRVVCLNYLDFTKVSWWILCYGAPRLYVEIHPDRQKPSTPILDGEFRGLAPWMLSLVVTRETLYLRHQRSDQEVASHQHLQTTDSGTRCR
jgi:hypothetical protein